MEASLTVPLTSLQAQLLALIEPAWTDGETLISFKNKSAILEHIFRKPLDARVREVVAFRKPFSVLVFCWPCHLA